MAKVWIPVSGDFHCPGRMTISADEIGITIGTGRRALATSEWPGENIRLCQAVETPKEELEKQIEDLEYVLELAQRWCSEYHTHYYGNQRVEGCSEFETLKAVIENLKKESSE